MNSALPKGWVESQLGIVCTKPQYGWTTSSKPEGEIKLLRTTDISNVPVNWKSVPFCEREPEDIEKYQININDILVSRAGSIGLSYRIREDDLINKTVFASYLIRFKPLINPQFAEYYLNSNIYWEYISGFKSGIAVPNVNATKLSDMPFPLPPLPEQKRIAAKLDAVLPRVEKLKERLYKTQELVKQFRRSVLNAAVTGKLTEEWREKNLNIGTWKKVCLGDIIKIKSGNFLLRKNMESGEIPVFGGNGITGYHNESNIATPTIVIGRVGYYCGSIYLTPERAWITDNAFITNFKSDIISQKYLYYLLLKSELGKLSNSTAQPVISGKLIYPFKVILPPLEEQKEIVRQVEDFFTLSDKLVEQAAVISERVKQLGQSVLAKAFRGELVPTEAELTEKEGHTFETAKELLERIKAEKKKLEEERKSRGNSRIARKKSNK